MIGRPPDRESRPAGNRAASKSAVGTGADVATLPRPADGPRAARCAECAALARIGHPIAGYCAECAEYERRRRCCHRFTRGLIFADGYRCPRHTTDADRALLDQLDGRGKARGVTPGRWPYGPNLDVPTRERMLDWAERHDLRLSTRGRRCLHWLRKGRCAVAECLDDFLHRDWMDHVTTWTRHGRPAVLVAQPYHLRDDDAADLADLDDDPALHVQVSDESWYGHGTWFVGVWRADAAAGVIV